MNNNHTPTWRATLAATACSFGIVLGLGYLFLAVVSAR